MPITCQTSSRTVLHFRVITKTNEELVHIYYSALNFRNVMTATGNRALHVFDSDRLNQVSATTFVYLLPLTTIYITNTDHFCCSCDPLTTYSSNVNSSEVVYWVCFGSCSSVISCWEISHLDVSCVIYSPTVLLCSVSVSAWNYEDSTSGRSWVVP